MEFILEVGMTKDFRSEIINLCCEIENHLLVLKEELPELEQNNSISLVAQKLQPIEQKLRQDVIEEIVENIPLELNSTTQIESKEVLSSGELNYQLAKKEHQLSELEHLYFQLEILREKTGYRYSALHFKHPSYYLTGDGLLLGSIAWYTRCVINGIKINVVGKTEKQCLENTIKLFVKCTDHSARETRRIVYELKDKQREQNTDSINIRYI